MPAAKVSNEEILSTFETDETLDSIVSRLGTSTFRVRKLWIAQYGDEAVEARARKFKKGAPEGAKEESFAAFSTDEPFKAVAQRLGMSPNTLRVLWKDRFGEEAFKARGVRIQQLGATEFGKRIKGVPKGRTSVASVDAEIHKPETCPVCECRCSSLKGLTTHLYRSKDLAHQEHVRQLEEAKWAGKKEGVDYVTCRVCGLRGGSLNLHLKTHGLKASEYRAKFPGAPIQSETCKTSRSAAISKSHVVSPRKGLKKTIQCPGCGALREVALTFAPKMHEMRCAECLAKDQAAEEEAKWVVKKKGEDYVVCLGCGYRAENLTSHVQNSHPEWVGCYPGQMVALNSAVRDKTALRGRTLSEEVKAKMSANAGRWNAGLTKETDPRVAAQAEHRSGQSAWNKDLTKETHPSVASSSEKLSEWSGDRRYWDNGLKADLSKVDFTPFLDDKGAVDRRAMSQKLGLSEPTITKYMERVGLRLSTKYVDARVEGQTIRLEKETLTPFALANGKVMIARAMVALGYDFAVIKRECERHDLPTFNRRVRQTICLNVVAKVLGGVPYQQEWESLQFRNPPTGRRFRFDGYFPSHQLLVEFHGYQHWEFPSVFVKDEAVFKAMQERDRIKAEQVRASDLTYFCLREDEPYADEAYVRERLLDEGVLG